MDTTSTTATRGRRLMGLLVPKDGIRVAPVTSDQLTIEARDAAASRRYPEPPALRRERARGLAPRALAEIPGFDFSEGRRYYGGKKSKKSRKSKKLRKSRKSKKSRKSRKRR